MPTAHQIRPVFFLILFIWTWYLITIAPSVLFFDSPEFINTAFALGISHPAGFPLYNLLAKGFTLAPLGSIPFRVNLFSAISSLVALGLVACAGMALLRILFPDRNRDLIVWSVVVPTGYLAISKPYWLQSLQAEVYTLHVALTAALILLMLLWKLRDDVRYLYGAGLLFGLSAGNHATVAFYLPAVLVLFFCWCRENRWTHLARCICLFLLGLSIYAYLPLRSINEPSFDFGNPETVDGFFYQVTDRRHSYYHFRVFDMGSSGSSLQEGPSLSQKAAEAVDKVSFKAQLMAKRLYQNIGGHLSWVCFVGLFVGGFLCYKRSRPIFVFLLVIAGSNFAFFFKWGRESILPTYVVACLMAAVMLAYFLDAPWSSPKVKAEEEDENQEEEQAAGFRWKPIVWAVLVLMIPFNTIRNLVWVDLADIYSGDALMKKFYLKLENNSLFLPGMSWFYYYYLQDVERLRDDITAVPAWDLVGENPPGMLTSRRYPDLKFPPPDRFDFSNMEDNAAYNRAFLELNRESYPVILEHNPIYLDRTGLESEFIPNRVLFAKYAPETTNSEDFAGMNGWQEFTYWTGKEIERSFDEENRLQGVEGLGWGNMPKMMLMGVITYARDTHRYPLEAEALSLQINKFTGETARFYWQWLENRLHLNKPKEAEAAFKALTEKYPEAYETRLAHGRMSGRAGLHDQAISHFMQAARMKPPALQPHLEMAGLYARMNNSEGMRKALDDARQRIVTLRDLAQFKKRVAEIKKNS